MLLLEGLVGLDIPEIVKFHQDFQFPNVIDHLILNECQQGMTIYQLYQKIYRSYSVVTYVYIDKRTRMLHKNGLLVNEMFLGSKNEYYCISKKGLKYLKFMDCWKNVT